MKSEMIVGNNLFVAQNLFVILLDPAQERGKGIGEMDILNKKRGIHLDSSFESGRRGSNPRPSAWKANALSTELLPQFLWAVMDSNHRRRKSAELQSAPFGHSGNCPHYFLLRCKGTINFVTCKKNLSFLLQ